MGRELRAGRRPAEADGDAAVVVVGGGDVVDAVRAALVGLEEPLGVVDRDRPEPVDRYVAATVSSYSPTGQAGVDADVGGLRVGQAAPAGGRADEVADRVDVLLAAEAGLEARSGRRPGPAGPPGCGRRLSVSYSGITNGRSDAALEAELVLDGGHGGQVVGVARIDEGAGRDHDVAGCRARRRSARGAGRRGRPG